MTWSRRVRLLSGCALLGWLGGCDKPAATVFEEAGQPLGLRFEHQAGRYGDFRLAEITGSGAAVLDYDSDGDLDVFLVQGEQSDGELSGNRLFRNDLVPSGVLRFTDVSAEAGDLGRAYGIGVAVADIDNDADSDILVTGIGPDTLLLNEQGRFRDISAEAGIADRRWTGSALFADYDADGDLDLFVTAYLDDTAYGDRECFNRVDQRDYCSPGNFRPLSDRLYDNDGSGRFTDVSEATGIASATGNGLGVIGGDFDANGLQDFYVANDQTANHLWLQTRPGQFEERGLMAGAAYNADGRAEASMGITSADLDGNGYDDLYLTHLNGESNTLYLNGGDGSWRDATDEYGLGSPSLQYTGWGALWVDLDNDTDIDLFVANGAVMADAAQGAVAYGQRNQLYINETGRLGVRSLGDLAENSRGAAFGDIDNDGDIDVVVANNNGPARLYLNHTSSRNHWLQVSLRGHENNSEGIGARLLIRRPATMSRVVTRGGSFASSNDARAHFGLGNAREVDLLVLWPSGRREVFRGISANQHVLLAEASGEPPGEAMP